MISAHTYAQGHAERFVVQLCELVRIPSISTLPRHAGDVERASKWLMDDMKRIGMTHTQVFRAEGRLPIVYGEWLGAGQSAPTVLIYCHYDVQPAELSDGWLTPPFEPTIKDDKIYGRGTLDSKIHVVAHLKAVESLLATGGAPVNIKLLFEGEEESGSGHLDHFVRQNADKLRADVIVISDGSMPDPHQPVLEYGLRGILTMQVNVTGPQRDLHSGHYGGNVHNPIQALVEILAKLHDESARVTVAGFYDDILPLTPEERAVLAPIAEWVATEWQTVANAPAVWGEPDFALHERVGTRPTLEINGIAGGFYEEGFKTVIPHKAWAKISCRLVPNQNPERIAQAVMTTIRQLAPPTIEVSFDYDPSENAPGLLLDYNSPAMQRCIRAYEKGWGVRPLLNREGGSVPIATTLQETLSGDMVLMPFGYKGGGAHSTNEYIITEMFHKGIATALHFYTECAKL